MNVLLGLKVSSNSLMVCDVSALRDVDFVNSLDVMTDSEYESEVNNVSYHYLPKIISKIPVLRLFLRIPIIYWICKKKKIDVIIGFHLTSYGLVGYLVGKVLSLPVCMHFLGNDIDQLCRHKLLGKPLLNLASRMNVLTVQGQRSKHFLEEHGLINVHIIPTACDLTRFACAKVPKKYDLIFLGRLSPEKRVDRFGEIVSLVIRKKRDLRAAIVGTGPEEQRVLSAINQNGLAEHIEYIGWTDAVSEYLNKSRVYVLTSDNDQLPSTLLEAMACGLVPVAADVGNVSDVVDEKNGYLVNPDDLDGYVSAILELLNNGSTYRGKAEKAIQTVQGFSIRENTRRWSQILSQFKREPMRRHEK